MIDFTPTAEQQFILDAAKSTDDNISIRALAGAAKTSTLIMIAKALRNKAMLCLAFNKSIQVEMQERLPTTAVALTLNSLGHRAWAKQIGTRLRLDKSKTYNLVTAYIEEKLRSGEKDEAYESLTDTIRAIDSGKSAGYIPDKRFEDARPLMRDDEFFEWCELDASPLIERIIREVSVDSIALALAGNIDFNDQILMPTVFPSSFPLYPIVLIDEAQDLSSLNHAMLRKIAKKRIIAVGDPCQAIYGFRGAHEESMELLEEQFHMKQMHLTVSFRCPTAVVEAARWRAPQMQWPEWAKSGEVKTLHEWTLSDIPAGAAILCRNNAPLFALAVKFMKVGRFPTLKGNKMGAGLTKIMKAFGNSSMKRAEVFDAIDAWERKRKTKVKNHDVVEDNAECMRIFASHADDLGGAIAYLEHLMNSSGPLYLMTGHGSKGLEYNNVFILDQQLLAPKGQDLNLKYVMQTRAIETLTYIDSNGLLEEREEE